MAYYLEVRNRKVEQFFYAHGVDFVGMRKDAEGMTIWKYSDTEENRRILDEFIHAQRIREEQRKQKYFKVW